MNKGKNLKRISRVMMALALLMEAAAVFAVARLNILPTRYFGLLLLAAAVLAAVMVLLTLWPRRRRGKRHGRRIVALIVSAAVLLGSAAACFAAVKTQKTLSGMGGQTGSRVKYGVYVMKTDSAQTIADAKDYHFGICSAVDGSNAAKVVKKINQNLNASIQTTECAAMTELVDSLYNQKTPAIIMRESYGDVLKDYSKYADFKKKTRLLYEVTISSKTVKAAAVRDITRDPFVVYISGSDTRSTTLTTSRSDVNILMAVNPKKRTMQLINTPRDYYIANPAGSGAKDKLTHCGIYGIDNSVQALSELYGTTVNYYGQINFTGFEKLIDEIGGIDVASDVAFTASGVSFKKGTNHLNGEQALVFARERHALSGGDNARGKNQMKVIAAVVAKMTGGSAVTNFGGIMGELQNTYKTNMKSSEMTRLMQARLSGGSWTVEQYAVTGTDSSATTYSMPGTPAYVMIPNDDSVGEARVLIQNVLKGN
jgi:LCP family protein required for cell wall assembly